MVECRPWKAEAVGSSPTTLTNAVIAQLAERLPCKQDVVGAIPTGSTIFRLLLMAGKLTLNQLIVVRSHEPEPSNRLTLPAYALLLARHGNIPCLSSNRLYGRQRRLEPCDLHLVQFFS